MAACVSVMHSHKGGLSAARNFDMVSCWHTASIYIWINMRKNQINKRRAGKNNPVKDQTAGSLHPSSCRSLLPPFFFNLYLYSLAGLCSHVALPSLTFLTCLLSNYTFTFNIHFQLSIFLHLPPSSISFFDFMASHIFNLALPPFPLSNAPSPPFPPLPLFSPVQN